MLPNDTLQEPSKHLLCRLIDNERERIVVLHFLGARCGVIISFIPMSVTPLQSQPFCSAQSAIVPALPVPC